MLKLILAILGGVVVGGILGYIGKCSSGTCPLTATPIRGIIVGGILGLLIGFSFLKTGSTNANKEVEMSSHILKISSQQEFDEKIINSNKICLVDFYANWCAPCRALSKTINKIAEEYKNQENLIIAKVDIEQQEDLAKRFGIKSIPCVILFDSGKENKRLVGLKNKNNYTEEIDNLLNKDKK